VLFITFIIMYLAWLLAPSRVPSSSVIYINARKSSPIEQEPVHPLPPPSQILSHEMQLTGLFSIALLGLASFVSAHDDVEERATKGSFILAIFLMGCSRLNSSTAKVVTACKTPNTAALTFVRLPTLSSHPLLTFLLKDDGPYKYTLSVTSLFIIGVFNSCIAQSCRFGGSPRSWCQRNILRQFVLFPLIYTIPNTDFISTDGNNCTPHLFVSTHAMILNCEQMNVSIVMPMSSVSNTCSARDIRSDRILGHT
jgi:hypothetical protein